MFVPAPALICIEHEHFRIRLARFCGLWLSSAARIIFIAYSRFYEISSLGVLDSKVSTRLAIIAQLPHHR